MKEKMKRILSVSLAVLMILTSIPMMGFVGLDLGFTAEAALATEGKCGDSANWKYDAKTKTLTVSGTGKMWDYDYHEPEYMVDPETDIEKVVIENGITYIGIYAFSYECVESVTLAESVTTIGYGAFSETSITEINFPKSLKVIESEAFYECSKLKKVTLPTGIEKVDEYAFGECKSLKSFNSGSGSVKLDFWAVASNDKLQKYTIGKNTELAKNRIEYIANSTAYFSVHKDNPYYTSDENGVLYNKDKTVLLAYPALSKTESFTVPATVKVIENNAFSNSKNLKTVKMTSVEEIKDMAFNSGGVKSVSLGSKLKKLGEDVFLFCENLKSLDIPANLSEFTTYSFSNTISYTVNKNNKALAAENGNLFNKNKTVMLSYYTDSKATSYKLPSTVTEIAKYAFSETKKLKTVTFPSKLKIIDDGAFWCSSVTSVTIPKSVEIIGESAFDDSMLKKLVIENGSTAKVKEFAFYGCEKLTDITIPATVTDIKDSAFENTGYIYKLEENGYEGPVYIGHILCGYIGYYGPTTLSIKEGTTTLCGEVIPEGTVTVKIPKSVKHISEDVFSYAPYVTSISLDKKNESFVYENNTLMTKDKTRIIKYVNSIFKTSYKIPATVEKIDFGAFETAVSLSKIDFSACAKEKLDINRFSATKWYASLPRNELIYIDNVAVGSTHSYATISAVSVKDGTKAIGDNFANNFWPEAMYIPSSVEYVGCLTDTVYYAGTKEQWNSIKKSESVKELEESGINIVYGFDKNNHEHKFYKVTVNQNTCLMNGSVLYTCPCGEKYTETTPKLHHYGTYYLYEKPATFKSKGKKILQCDMCGKEILSKATAPVASIALKKTTYTYTGEEIEMDIVVKDTNGNIIEDCAYPDYTADLVSIGTHKVTVFLDDYIASGQKTFTIDIVPGKTSKLSATQSDSAVKLTWNKVKGATGYRVFLYNTKTKKYEKAGDTTGTSYTVKKLKSGTTYKFAVRAYTKVGKKVYWASSYTTITTATKPSAPVVKTKAGSKKVALSWEKVRGATGYQVYMMNSEGKYEKLATTKELKYVKTGLKKGASYSFRVRAYKKIDGATLYSSYKTYTVKAK